MIGSVVKSIDLRSSCRIAMHKGKLQQKKRSSGSQCRLLCFDIHKKGEKSNQIG